MTAQCTAVLDQPVKSEAATPQQLDGLVNECLTRQGLPAVTLGLDFGWRAQAGRARRHPGRRTSGFRTA
jgi:two-component system sensor histidine kinase BaeS